MPHATPHNGVELGVPRQARIIKSKAVQKLSCSFYFYLLNCTIRKLYLPTYLMKFVLHIMYLGIVVFKSHPIQVL